MLMQIEEVKYCDEIPDIDYFKSRLYDSKFKDDLTELIATKSTHWQYESEYRLILWDHPNTLLKIGHDTIVEVILGCRITELNRSHIMALLQESECKAKVYQAHKHDHLFALSFEQIP